MTTLKRIGLVFGGLIFGLLLAEVLARLSLPRPTRQIALLRTRAPDLQMDAATNIKNPGYNPFIQRRPFGPWTCDGKTPETMNNEGFRDRPFTVEKPADKKQMARSSHERDVAPSRMAAIGDSFTEGWMGPREAAFPRVLEGLASNKLEVLNFGLANRSPIRYLPLYDQIVRKYHPDIVLVCLYQNDPAEDDALRHYAKFDARGVPSSFDYARYFRNTPRMPQTWLEKRLDKLQLRLCLYSRLFPYLAIYGLDEDYRKRTLEAPPAASFDSLWKNTARYLLTLRDLVQKDGPIFLLAYAPDQGDFVKPDPLLAATRRLAAENRIPFFGADQFLGETNHAALYIPGDGHFSVEGHRRFARELAEWLRNRKL